MNHKFKIGDKVKLNGLFCGISGNDTGKVVGIGYYIKVLWDGYLGRQLGHGSTYPHRPNEIKHAIRVGEQLQFSFMN